jgi:uridine phosphorylase
MRFFPATDLVLNSDQQVYHLGLSPNQIADKIILVGDQDRVSLVSAFFSSIEHRSQHREFTCHTGMYKGQRISALSTGIGTDNIDIVVNELDALVNIDLKTRKELEQKKSLHLVRIGTCGILQEHIPVHSFIVSEFAIGFDNIAHYYDLTFSELELEICNAFQKQVDLPKNVVPYCSQGDSDLFKRLNQDGTYSGITITSSGFYGPQGRSLRLPTHTENLHIPLGKFKYNNLCISNFEMESSALFSLSRGLNHQASTICLGIANRPNFEFSKGYSKKMNELIEYTLEALII